MLRAIKRLEPGGPKAAERTPDATLTLPFDLRQKSRLRGRLDDGREVALLLARGSVLRGGDRLLTQDDQLIEIRAADEPVSTVSSPDPLLLCRVCYHLGNRHVPVEIGADFVRYQRDSVLDVLVTQFDLKARSELCPFEPEAGAYKSEHRSEHHHA